MPGKHCLYRAAATGKFRFQSRSRHLLYYSSDWGTFYWVPGPYWDYAPSGMPDFDQKQTGWTDPGGRWTYCGPVAAANALWWLDSRFEMFNSDIPPTMAGSYPLVSAYDAFDDHDVSNLPYLVNDLADNGVIGDFSVILLPAPPFVDVADNVTRDYAVILLLGFYEDIGGGNYVRVYGHFVTVSGVDPVNQYIAVSDPYLNAYGDGIAGSGRVLDGLLTIPHTPPGHGATIHNDAGNVSHDIFQAAAGSGEPGGTWGFESYPVDQYTDLFQADEDVVNPHDSISSGNYQNIGPVSCVVEYALVIMVN